MKKDITYIESKSILSKVKSPDPYFGITYNMNLFRGCQHGCIYCDTRSKCYGIHDISKISIKKNAIDLLRQTLQKKRHQKATIGTGSMNDPYMPFEKEEQITRRALSVIAEYQQPVHIITKSDLVARDTDLIQDISKTYAAVSFTITTADDSLAKKIEPFAPLSSLRFETIKKLASKGIYCGIFIMPILPFINDTIENISLLLEKAKDAGASYAITFPGVTLRKGSRDYFYHALDNLFPGMIANYQSAFGESYECFSPNYKSLIYTIQKKSMELNLTDKMKFYTAPSDQQLSLF